MKPHRVFVIAALAVTVAGCGSASHRQQATSSVVPWLDRQLPLYHVPPARPIPYSTSAPLCRARQLRVTQGRNGAAAGTYYERFRFENTSRTTCLLRGFPTITAIGPDGVRRPVRLERQSAIDNLVAADLRPRQHALLDIATPDGCVSDLRDASATSVLSFGCRKVVRSPSKIASRSSTTAACS